MFPTYSLVTDPITSWICIKQLYPYFMPTGEHTLMYDYEVLQSYS